MLLFKKFYILFQSSQYNSYRLFVQPDQRPRSIFVSSLIIGCLNEILVLQSGRWLSLPFDFSVNQTTLQIKYCLQIFWILKLRGIFHQHYMNFFHELRVYCKNSKNFSYQRVFVCSEMLTKKLKFVQVEVQLFFCHCFNYKFSIMRKEKERTTSASSLSSFENHVSIKFRTK